MISGGQKVGKKRPVLARRGVAPPYKHRGVFLHVAQRVLLRFLLRRRATLLLRLVRR
jgi:hypothetical protein